MEIQSVPGYLLDIKDILLIWMKSNRKDFQSFKSIWADMEFSYIHAARPDMYTKKEWIQALYEASFGYLYIDDLSVRVGTIFLLYMLYETQPSSPKIKINISLSIWKEINQILNDAELNGYEDACRIYVKMKKTDSLCLTSQVNIVLPPSVFVNVNTSSTNSSMINFDTLTGVIDIDKIKDASDKYIESKKLIDPNTEDYISQYDIHDKLKEYLDNI